MEDKITGVMIYYYFICKRKLWYFCHQITMEDGNENVQLGKLQGMTSILILMMLLILISYVRRKNYMR